jgi:hypothetical protein
VIIQEITHADCSLARAAALLAAYGCSHAPCRSSLAAYGCSLALTYHLKGKTKERQKKKVVTLNEESHLLPPITMISIKVITHK